MIPIGDDLPTYSFPFVTVVLIIINVTVFLYELSLGSNLGPFVDRFGIIPEQVNLVAIQADPRDLASRFVGSAFIHGGWLHLGGNILYLWIFGDNVEDALGHVRYFFFYFFGGAVAMTAHVFSSPDSVQPVIGASGAIAGVLGAYLVMFPRARVFVLLPLFIFFPVIAVPAVFALGFWFIEQLLSGVGAIGASTASLNVAWWAHIGGFTVGMLVTRYLMRKKDPLEVARFR